MAETIVNRGCGACWGGGSSKNHPQISRTRHNFKASLKKKSDEENLTDIEKRQLRLLDYPASKQFLICVVGDLREEIAGHKVSDHNSFEGICLPGGVAPEMSPNARSFLELWT